MLQNDTLKSKSFWTGIAQMIAGIAMLISGDDAQTGVTLIGTGATTVVLRDAVSKNSPPAPSLSEREGKR